jgi:putative transposase
MKTHYSSAELAAMKLPGQPGNERRMRDRARKEGWASRQVPGKGGKGGMRTEYAVSSLSAAVRDAILAFEIKKYMEGKNDGNTTGAVAFAVNADASGDIAGCGNQSGHGATDRAGFFQRPGTAVVFATGSERVLAPIPDAQGLRIDAISGKPAFHNAGRNGAGKGAVSVALGDHNRSIARKNLANSTTQTRLISGARATICRHILNSGIAQERTINALCEASRDETKSALLPPELQRAIELAKAKKRAEKGLYRSTVKKWLGKYKAAGVDALIPCKNTKDLTVSAEMLAVLAVYQRPQKPSLTAAAEEAAKQLGIENVSALYHRAKRFKDKVSVPDLMRGRMGHRELKSLLPFVRRDTSTLLPGEVFTADGHTFDAEIAHPKHGRPFRPEITAILDVHTRKCVGWSIDLAESGFAVLDALSMAVMTHGIPLIFYVDNGSGYKNALMSDPSTGMMSRLGISMEHSLPYNSQARGIIERSHKSIWVKAAKKLPTYMGADMDKEARQRVFKITRADIKASGSSRLLLTMTDFVQFCAVEIDEYNTKPQRGLPKFREPATGRMRHYSPSEYWDIRAGETQIILPTAEEVRHLVRPQDTCKVRQGEIRLLNNIYFNRDLAPYHGDTVRVSYSATNPARIWVYDLNGIFLAEAEWNANKHSYFAESVLEQKAYQRAQGRIKRAEAKIEEAEAELNSPQIIEHQPSVVPPIEAQPQIISIAQEISEPSNIVPLPVSRPMFTTDAAKYRWLKINASQINEQDDTWLDWYVNTDEWNDLFGDVAEVAAR